MRTAVEERNKKIVQMVWAGKDVKSAADAYGTSVHTVYAALKKYGKKPRKAPSWVIVDDVPPEPQTHIAAAALEDQIGGDHYKNMAIQPIEFIHANKLGFIEGNVIKYTCRWAAKGGIQDLDKARHYIDMLIEMEGRK